MDFLNSKLVSWIKHHSKISKYFMRLILSYCDLFGVRKAIWKSGGKYHDLPSFSTYKSDYPYTIGIVKEFCDKHLPYIAACRDLRVSYKVIDISGPDWLREVERSGCDAFLVGPYGLSSVWKQMYDERLRVIACDLGVTIFPNYESMWLYESKRRMHYWLKAHNVPRPKTWIFYDLKEALDFVEQAVLPIVYKSDFGSGSSGVRIFRKRSALRRHVKKCFTKGFRTYTRCLSDKEWGSVFLQEYLQDVKEWRAVRLGESFFGHQKLKKNDFHSGSDRFAWINPPDKLLNFVSSITDIGGFKSMNLDIFETDDGRYLVNELQAHFGWIRPYQMMVDGKVGRYLYDNIIHKWIFEEGVFCQNGGCNLRLAYLMACLGINIELVGTSDTHLVSEEDRISSKTLSSVGAGKYSL